MIECYLCKNPHKLLNLPLNFKGNICSVCLKKRKIAWYKKGKA